MAAAVASQGAHRDPDESAIDAAIARAEAPFGKKLGDLAGLRDRLWQVMWDDVGILRTDEGLRRGLVDLDSVEAELRETGLPDGDRAFNLTWHDWMNLESLIDVSRVIAKASLARGDSRGAHFREDFPETGPLETTTYTQVRRGDDGALDIAMVPVDFSIVKPGDSLIDDAVGAPEAVA